MVGNEGDKLRVRLRLFSAKCGRPSKMEKIIIGNTLGSNAGKLQYPLKLDHPERDAPIVRLPIEKGLSYQSFVPHAMIRASLEEKRYNSFQGS
jgi:hypothetical protein